jgi:hypothetical protein
MEMARGPAVAPPWRSVVVVVQAEGFLQAPFWSTV